MGISELTTTLPWLDNYERVKNKMIKFLRTNNADEKAHFSKKLYDTYAYCFDKYKDIKRLNGDSLFDHVQRSTEFLLLVHPDLTAVQLCLLHEIYQYELADEAEIKQYFGERTAVLLKKFTDLKKVHINESMPYAAETLRQMMLVLADEVEVILVKLATRLHSIMTVEVMPRYKQVRLAREVLEIFAPIASRMGLYALKTRMEDEAFKVLQPRIFNHLNQELEHLMFRNNEIIEVCKKQVTQIIREHKLKGTITGRVKSVYSIARKLEDKKLGHAGELNDIFAIRVIVPTKEDCYRLLGYVHERFPPMSGRIKDYIALPKANNYQSLHTTVTQIYSVSPERPVEIQIRTQEMDDVAEYGVASHSNYKEMRASQIATMGALEEKLATLSKDFSKNGKLTSEQRPSFKALIRKIFIMTPKGDVITLPAGAGPLDFAYSIHTEVGHKCISAKVNGKIVPLSYKLHTGDTVEIVTRADHIPTATSLMYVHTASARAKIKNFLYAQRRDDYLKRGYELFDAMLAKHNKMPLDAGLSILEKYAHYGVTLEQRENILINIGKGNVKAETVFKRIFELPSRPLPKVKTTSGNNLEALKIAGNTGFPYTLAKCCLAHTADVLRSELVAFMTVRGGIKIHKATCPFLGKNKDRILTVE